MMECNRDQLKEVAARLRELQSSSPVVKADLEGWNERARQFDEDLPVNLPPSVMHYLHDADIRITDSSYRRSQDSALSEVIAMLESGSVPRTSSMDISFLVGCIAIVLLFAIAVICFWAFG